MANMQVTVVDGNNVTVSLDRGVAGVGIASISLVVINQENYLLITYTNGTTQTVGPVGVIQYNATTPINISGSTISLLTVPVNLGGTGQTTAAAGLNALLPAQTSQANKYLQTDGTNASWDAISLSTADITGTLPVVNGGSGVSTSTGTGNTVLSTSPTLVTPVLGTPASGTLTNATGLPVATGISGLGAGIATFLATPSSANLAAALTDETGTGAAVFAINPTLVTPALGTPTSGVMTNVTGTASGLTAGNVTTNANLTGMVTSVGNATTVVTNANLTGGVTSIGNAATVITNANLTGDITSVGNATAIAAGVIVNADINASAAIDDTKLATIATALKVSNSATTAASANTNSAIVARDASGNFAAGIVTAALTGNASTATALATGRTIAITGDLAYTSPSFDGSANVTAASTLATVATAGVTGSSTAIPVVTINAKGLTTSIATAAVIAPAGTLSGNTLAAGVTGSSLTSLGTIANLSVTAGTISTTPSASTDIANKDYVDTVAQGLDPKASCVAATTVNITLSGTQTIDGVALIAADRCLVKDQTAPAENGIYVVAAGAWARSADMDNWFKVPGAFTFIEQGTAYADTGWVCTSNAGGTLGTTAITFVQFAGAGSYTASTGLNLTGTAFSLTAPVTVALGGTNATSAGITAFNNISGFTAAGATGTTSTNLVFSTSPTLVTPILGTPQSATLTNATGLPLTTGVTGTLPVANGGTGLTAGTSGGVLAYTAAGTLASSTALAASALVIGGGAGAAPSTTTTGTGILTFLGTPSSANLLAAVTDETGTGALVFATNPTLVTPALGTPSSGVVTNLTGTASININGTVGATTPATGVFTTLRASGAIAAGTANSLMLANNGTGESQLWALGPNTTTSGTLNIVVARSNLTSSSGVLGISAAGLAVGGTLSYTTTLTGGTGIVNIGSGQIYKDASGNVGIGTPSPESSSGGFKALTISDTVGAQIYWKSTNSSITAYAGVDSSGGYLATLTNTALLFRTNNTERARISSDGTFRVTGAGTAGSTDAFQVAGGAPADAARIDSSGNLLVGTTSTNETSGTGGRFGADGYVRSTRAATIDASSTLDVYSTGASAFRFYVGMGGTVFATSITISAISDQRLKENVRDIDTGLNSIMALKPRRFDWKEGKGQDKKNVAGFIAQEFENVFPECVGTTKAGGDGVEYKNINHETLIPTLVKAIQEQQALITALTARITALESN